MTIVQAVTVARAKVEAPRRPPIAEQAARRLARSDIVRVTTDVRHRLAAHLGLAHQFLTQKRFAQSAGQAREAIAVAPDQGPAHAALAISLAYQGDRDAAGAAASTAIARSPENGPVFHVAATVALLAGDLDLARARARESCRLAPEDGHAWRQLATLAFNVNDFDEAARAADAALAIDGEDAHALMTRGFVALARGDRAAAIRDVDAAVAIAPDDAYVRCAAGRLRQRHDPVGAIRHFRESLRRKPDLELAERSMVRAARSVRARHVLPLGMRVCRRVSLVVLSAFLVGTLLGTLNRQAAWSAALGWAVWPATACCLYTAWAKRRAVRSARGVGLVAASSA